MGGCLACCSDCLDFSPEINPERVDLSHFLLHRVVGRGGFGKVHVVESRVTGAMYALKSMEKAWLVQSASNVRSVWLERHITVQLRSNFLVHTHFAFQDERRVYLVMHFLPGGDLHFLMHSPRMLTTSKRDPSSTARPLPEEHVKFYMAEILIGLEEMHSVGLVYRDLKPENVLLDAEGHVRLSDFGLAGDLNAEEDGMTMGACGTSGYMSQELLANLRYDFTPDVYAFGVVMYELLHGLIPPPYEEAETLQFRTNVSADCANLLVGLLQHDPARRIGCDPTRVDRWTDVKSHPWFADLDWAVVSRRGLTPPFRPAPDIANCDPMFELEEQLIHEPLDDTVLTEEEQAVFDGWDWHTEVEHHTKASRDSAGHMPPVQVALTPDGRRAAAEAEANSPLSSSDEFHSPVPDLHHRGAAATAAASAAGATSGPSSFALAAATASALAAVPTPASRAASDGTPPSVSRALLPTVTDYSRSRSAASKRTNSDYSGIASFRRTPMHAPGISMSSPLRSGHVRASSSSDHEDDDNTALDNIHIHVDEGDDEDDVLEL